MRIRDKKFIDSRNLLGQYDFTSNVSAVTDTWHAVVYKDPKSPAATYVANDPNAVVEEDFQVLESAIPEFPEVVAAIAVSLLCAGAYMVMRRKVGMGNG